MYNPYLKRVLDIFGALTGLLLLAIPMMIVAAMIRIKMGGPVVFRQVRAGKHCRDFVIYKFRTMTDEYDSEGKAVPNSLRITPFGRFLRKTSLDELPQLLNVLKGDMSLVGPRPLMNTYIPFYSTHELKRFDVLPGITGLAQVDGRHHANWDDRLANDVSYVKNLSLMLDIKIVLKTIAYVLRQSDVIVAPSEEIAHLHIARASNVASFPKEAKVRTVGTSAVAFENDLPILAQRRAG